MAFLCWKSLTPATNDPCHCSTSVIPIVVVVHSRASPDARLSLPPLCHKNQKLSPCSLCAAVKSSNVGFHGSTQGILYGGGSLLLARGSRKQFIAACIRDSLMESGGSRFAIKPATPSVPSQHDATCIKWLHGWAGIASDTGSVLGQSLLYRLPVL